MMKRDFGSYFTELDFLFNENVQLKFNKGRTIYKTKVGACATLLLIIIIFAYGLDRALIMFKFEKFSVSEIVDYDYYDETTSIGADLGLVFAFGIGSAN
jgi:hypothetical protein